MTPTPRQRAAAALAVIDRHHANPVACPHYAYQQLAEALHDEFGPLPDALVAWHLNRLETVEGAASYRDVALVQAGAPSTFSPTLDRPLRRGTGQGPTPLAGSTPDDWTPPHGIPRP